MGTFLPSRTVGVLEEEEEEGDRIWTEEDTTDIMDLMGEALKQAQLDEETLDSKSDCDEADNEEEEEEEEEDEEEQTSTCSVVREINTVMQVIAEVTSCSSAPAPTLSPVPGDHGRSLSM